MPTQEATKSIRENNFRKNKTRTVSEAFSRGQKNCRFLYPPLNHGERTIIPAPLKIFWQNILDFDCYHTCCAKNHLKKGKNLSFRLLVSRCNVEGFYLAFQARCYH